MKNENVINKDFLSNIDGIISQSQKLDEWFTFVKQTEPAFFDWIQNKTSTVISEFGNKYKMFYPDLNQLAFYIVSSFIVGYMVKNELSSTWIKDLMENNTGQFDKFRKGWLPGKFYKYSTKITDKSSTLYLAKVNHLDHIKSCKKKTLLGANKISSKKKELKKKTENKKIKDLFNGCPF